MCSMINHTSSTSQNNDNVGNVSHSEIEHFNEYAQSWWDPQGDMWTLHRLNPLRLQWIKSLVSLNDQHVLDVGCGGGLLTEAMACQGATVLGLDLAPQLIEVATAHAALKKQANINTPLNINYHCVALEELTQSSFDVITCMEMLEHVPDPEQIIAQCATRLKPGGLLVLSTLNQTAKAWLLGIVMAEHLLNWVPKGSHRLDKFIPPAMLETWARIHQLSLVKITGISYKPWLDSFYLSSDVSVNYMMAFQKNA
jgi:2-polyprenyl-6-hydroxyphenyl methylase/3-demethylubiquinone-9 3-methyltransferase